MRYALLTKPQQRSYGDINPLAIVDSIELKSNYTPDGLLIKVNAPSDPNTQAEEIAFLQKLQPEIIFHLNSGLGDHAYSPYGTPGPTKWGTIVTVTEVVGIGLFGFLAYGLMEAFSSRK